MSPSLLNMPLEYLVGLAGCITAGYFFKKMNDLSHEAYLPKEPHKLIMKKVYLDKNGIQTEDSITIDFPTEEKAMEYAKRVHGDIIWEIRSPPLDFHNIEEIQRQQQQQVENQMARQDGQPLSQPQQQALYGATPQQQKLIQRLRTQYIQRDDMICFTTKPVLSCINGSATQLKQVTVDFHCLPKTSPFTQQLIVESEKQVIKQLVNKRVDLRQQISVPVSCQ